MKNKIHRAASKKFKSFQLTSLAFAISVAIISVNSYAMKETQYYSPEKLSGNTVRVNSESKITEGIPGDIVLGKNTIVYGGRSEDMSQDANDNHLLIGKVPKMEFYAVGGFGKNVKNNILELETGMRGYIVEAGQAKELAEGNKLILKDITSFGGGDLIAGHVLGKIKGVGGDAPKIARNNEIHISVAEEMEMHGKILGGRADDVVEGNKVFLQGVDGLGVAYTSIVGGDVYDQDDKGLAKDNLVFIKKAKIGGASTSIIGGSGIQSLGNEIILWDVQAMNGARIIPGALAANRFYMTEDFEVGNNSIRLLGTTDVGTAELKATSHFKPEFVKSAKTYGNFLNFGYIDEDRVAHAWDSSNEKGNLVNKNSVESFQKLKFTAVKWDPERAALVTEEGADLSKMEVEAKGMVFTNLEEMEKAFKENPKGEMYLIDATSTGDLALQDKNISYDTKYIIGTALEGEAKAEVVKEGEHEGDLLYTLKNVKEVKKNPVAEQTHNVLIAQSAALASVNAGQNFVERALSGGLDQQQYGPQVYFATSGGYDKYKTGSHIKTNIWNANLSMVNTVELASGGLSYLAGFEYGTGSYDVKGDGVNGDGDINYQGLTLGTKYLNNSGFYTEGAARIGYVKNKANNVLIDGDGKAYSYETNGYYVGGHLGLGYILNLNENLNLNIYSKYSYMNIEKDKFNARGEYKLDAVESSIAKAGFRLNQAYNNWNFAYGLGIEHQFDGEAKGTAEGYAIKSADVGGTSGIIEFSATLKPSATSPWSFNFGVDGYVGRHQGVRGNLGLSYKF